MVSSPSQKVSAFLEASLEAGAAFVLSPCCARGSLQNILQDEDLQLDGVFVSSHGGQALLTGEP